MFISLPLTLLFTGPDAVAGRRDKLEKAVGAKPATSAAEIPALAELLERAGWQPTPELSGTFEAGAIFTVTQLGHQLALEGCFEVAPKVSTYTQAEVITQLQAGVSVKVGAGAGTVGAEVGLVKKVKFGTPTHFALPALEMEPTPDCEAKLKKAAQRGLALSQMYVVKEVLFAEIAEQTCGRVDIEGRFVGLGQAEAELAMACAQDSLEPVAVAYRTEAVTRLLGVEDAETLAASSSVGGADLAAMAAAAGSDRAARDRESREAEAAAAAARQREKERDRLMDEAQAALESLAGTYFEQGKFEQCVQTYRRLIAEDPQSPDAPRYQNEIIRAYQKIGRKKETVAEVDRLRKTYGRASPWAARNKGDPDALAAAAGYLEKNLRSLASSYHAEARKLGPAGRESYQLAYNSYKLYMSEFPDGKYNYDMRYGFAELLYELKRYDEAYDQYTQVVAIDPGGKHSKFCAEAAIFAAKEMVKKEGASGPAGRSTEPIALSEWEQKKLDALDQFARLYPDDQKAINIIYESAYLLYNRNHFVEASDRFRAVIAMNPGTTQAEQAANLILDSLILVEDWRTLSEVARALYEQPGLGSPQFKAEVQKIYEQANAKQ